MYTFFRLIKKPTKRFLLVAVLLCGALVYAMVDKTVYTTEQLVIIPGEVSSTDWDGLGSVLVQDLDDAALYQEFGKDNAAYLREGQTTPAVSESDSNATTDSDDSAGDVTATSTDGITQEEDSDGEPDVILDNGDTEVVPPVEEDLPSEDSSDTPPSPEESASVWGVFPYDRAKYPLAQFDETEPLVSPEESVSAVEEISDTNEVADQQPAVDDVAPEVTESAAQTDVTEGTADAEIEAEGAETSIDTAAEEQGSDDLEPVAQDGLVTETVSEDAIDSVVAVSNTIFDLPVPCTNEDGCVTKSMVLSGFTVPEFESGVRLDGAQLRMSLGAQLVDTARSEVQRFVIEYTYALGDQPTWEVASVVDITDEISNSLNGGYQLISIPTPRTPGELSALRVRLSYQGVEENLRDIYLDGVWLEVTSGHFYEQDDFSAVTDEIEYERSLEAPKMHELLSEDTDVGLNTLPSFSLAYDPQENFLRRVFNWVFSENSFSVDTVTLVDAAGVAYKIPFEVVYNNATEWTIKFLEQPQKLRVGKYRVVVDVLENDKLYRDSFEFYWGVLAVNTTKSMYFAGEQVTFNLAALTDEGETICNADLRLKVISPSNTIHEVPVRESGSCNKNNVTVVPDYLADFSGTEELGVYQVQLQHYNKDGELVHKVTDGFEVREYIPYDITRTAPTRIYPPAPYDVSLDIKAYRDFVGDITERVPRGFLVTGAGTAEIVTLPEYTEIVWKNVAMKEGDELTLSYQFDAPDISPYTYLLGPLDMDGFKELRHWQIASDALGGIAWLTGTQSVLGTNLNQTASALVWSTSSIDSAYYTHSTTTNPQRLTIKQAGDYYVGVNLPLTRTGGSNARTTRVGLEVRVNGVTVPQGLGRSGFITLNNGHAESNSDVNFMIPGLAANDYLEVFVEGLTTINGADTVQITTAASAYVELLQPATGVFAATTTRTTNSTNLNQTTAYGLEWTETRQDSGFVHSDAVSPEQITISSAGVYLVHVNVPLTGDTTQQNVLGRVRLDGNQVSGGIFGQGFLLAATDSDTDSSIHWSGIVVATTTNQILTVTTERDGAAGTTSVTSGFEGSILIEKLPATDLIALTGVSVVAGANWNAAATSSVQWNTQLQKDATVFTHSTSTNSHLITIQENGDYYLAFNGAFNSATAQINNKVSVHVNGVAVPVADAKSNYLRNASGHNNASANMGVLLSGLVAGNVVTVSSVREAQNGTMDDTTPAMVVLWQKAQKNFEPSAPTMYSAPFDNIRFASTTPYFDFSATDPDGSSDIQYEFSISTSSDFSASTTKISGTDAGFTNTASSTDTSPFFEGNKIRFQLQSADALTDLTTYYWRVRAKDTAGSGQFSDWSTTQSLTVNMANAAPDWYQTYSGQFDNNSLVGAVSSGDDSVQVDATENSEVLIAYGEGSVTTPRYRLWSGTGWGIEQSALAVSGTINWVKTAAGVSRDEYILVTIDSASDVHAQVYSGTSTSWGHLTQLTASAAAATRPGADVAYESNSGDALVVSCDNDATPVYRIWNGTSWSATSSITVTSTGNCNQIELASDPASDEIVMVMHDATAGGSYEVAVWNGSSWGNNKSFGTSPVGTTEAMTVAYESSGDEAVVAVANGAAASLLYVAWNGSEWTASPITQTLGNDFMFGELVADPNSDNMTLCYVDTDVDIGALRWNGGIFSTFQELDVTGDSDTARPVDCEFETIPGRSGYQFVPYSDTANVRYQVYATSTWLGTEGTVTGITGSAWVQSERAGDGTIIMVAHDDAVAGDALQSSYWNGTAWSTKEIIENSPSSVALPPFEIYHMSAKRFQFTQGVVTSGPISFSAVPSQPTWGDISFSTSEPFGTDVTVRVKYTSTTTCDSYISNAVLPGNGVGFDATSTPIVLTALSTSTYSQLCLEATLTTLGSASATLLDWSLSWVREPKLEQSAFHWYANGSYLTPTDSWPAGSADVGEGISLTSAEAVSNSERIRLRLALRAANVPLPISTEIFKLQYAEGFTCSPTLPWRDVGGVGSSTALWRGYANSIVGDDWYSASWEKRIKITVENTLVSGSDISNFPVYVNLDDLPAAFFDGVQSDGDDIRITTSDGVTEVPYELVSIDTSTDTGELHFRATTLSTSTDTAFYIYYGNPSASGYAVGATYGRNNVWSNGFLTVYHLDQNPSAGAPQYIDSTGGSNGTNVGIDGGDRKTGIVGRYIDIDGAAEYVDLGSTFNRSFLNSTWQIWASSSVVQGAYDGLVMTRATGETTGINVSSVTSRLGYHWRDAANTYSWTSGPTYPTSTAPFMATLTVAPTQAVMWRHAGIGVASSTNAVTHATGTVAALDVGQDPFGGRLWAGGIDEMSISNVIRSNGWIQTTYNNKSNSTGFYSVSTEQLIGDGRQLPSTLLTNSDHAETYEESNPTGANQYAVPVDNELEWDFVLQNNNATAATNYCFRMVYQDGSTLSRYDAYPRLITNAPPLTPVTSAPFDNEQLASTTPWFEFYADDELGDLVSYEIELDDDITFGSPLFNQESNASFSLFTNISSPAERGIYTQGQTIRFIPSTALTSGTTYWWRVRSRDDNGSGTYSQWSTPVSVTVNSGTTITTWLQTTTDQFETDALDDTKTNTNDIGLDTGLTAGTTTSTVIDFDDRDLGNAWGALSFTHNVSSGSIRYYVEYRVSGDTFALIPDSVLTSNSAGFTSSPVSLVNVDPEIYNELRIRAVFSGTDTVPRLQDWTVTWSQRIEPPVHALPFDNAKVSTTTPQLTFVTTDPQGDRLQYELQISSSYAFTSSSTYLSGVNAGFSNTASSSDISPFISGQTIRYQVQSALTNGSTYWWRLRARDPLVSNAWSEYSDPESFTVDTAVTVSTWYQTVGDQFTTDALTDIETTATQAQITSTIQEVMVAYGEGSGQAPQYRTWDGTTWSAPLSAENVGAQLRWLELRAAPTRPEYALATLGTDLDVNFQIYNAPGESWGNVFQMQTDSVASNKRTFNLTYETLSGDLLAVACNGTDAVYGIWNGSTWSATSSLNLNNTNNCEFVTLASDPTSDEIVAVFRHNNTSATDYEAWVWNGSSWGNNLQFGAIDGTAVEGMAAAYEESGNQAVVAVSNNPNATLLSAAWNGTAWATTSTTLGDRIEWATLKPDVGTDRLALCYVDNDVDIGAIIWNGSGWDAFSELETFGNEIGGRSIDCDFETTAGRDGYLNVVYSDDTATRYQINNGGFGGEISLDVITDTFEVQTVRGGDGLIHMTGYDDALTPDRIDHSRWDGSSWTARQRFSDNASLNGVTPYIGGSSMAAQIYPNFTEGLITSTPIDFADGAGPRWERMTWNDTTPGASDILYRVFYESAPDVYTIIPDSVLPGNAVGFGTSPINLSAVDRTIYSVLQVQAELQCDSGDCPSLQNWAVEWSEGITVSGTATEYDGVSITTSGTVAVAVNGVLQAGKTATISGSGTWSIANVTMFPGDNVLVFVDGASDVNEAIGLSTYGGVGDVTNMKLTKRSITVGSSDATTTANHNFIGYDNADDEDIFATFGIDGSLTACVESACADNRFVVASSSLYQPGANISVHDFQSYGYFNLATNTARIGGSWYTASTTALTESSVIFTATSSVETITNATSTLLFNTVTFGETSGNATWTVNKLLDVNGVLTVNYGTLARGTTSIALANNLVIGTNGKFSGAGTTTFDGAGSNTWTDNSVGANIGNVLVDGSTKTITLGSNVVAQSITIGSDDTLNASGSGFGITVYDRWINNNAFIAQTGTVTFIGTSTYAIERGASSFNNLTFNGAGGNWSFSSSTLSLTGSLTIATGTVTLPTGTTTIAGSFLNTGGTFLHNNGEVRFTSTSAGRLITQRATTFLNAFYDVVFTGSGSWSFTESMATTSRDFKIQSGTVTFPTGTLTVGGDFLTTGTGAFAHNNGELVLLVQDADSISTSGSSLNTVRITSGSSSWYNDSWLKRLPITIESNYVTENVTNFPVYVNLANLPASFFASVQTDGDDIRVTQPDGMTELPFELVAIDTVAKTGELHFKANSLSASSDTTFYLYFDNGAASGYATTSTYGRNNVWTNGYTAVYHLNESPTATAPQYIDSTGSTTATSFNMEVGDRQAGQVGNAQVIDGTNEYIQSTYSRTISTSTWSVWVRANGAQNGYDGVVFSRGAVTTGINVNSTGDQLGYHWNDTAATYGWNSGITLPTNDWFMWSLVALPTTATMYRHATSGVASSTNVTTHPGSNINDLKFGQDDGGGRFFNGSLDEVRISNVARTQGWLTTEYNNHASTSLFYAVGGIELPRARTFADTNVTVLGNYIAEPGGDANFPTGTMSVGGSFNNDADFLSRGGTVRFNSTAGSETIAVGSSTFSHLTFDSASGNFTITESATATGTITLGLVNQFTVASSVTLQAAGTFTQTALGSSTTWTGSTLLLSGGTDYAISAKSFGGDIYGTLQVTGDTDVTMWNSSATSVLTSGVASVYSQDHAGLDGDLYIYGDYARTSGTEYWSYATDFDGTALGSSSRAVDVRAASSSRIAITGATLAILGGGTASTTIDAQSGKFALITSSTTVSASNVTITGTNSSGLQLATSTAIATFQDIKFTVASGTTGITMYGNTITANPSEQYINIGFATTTAGSVSNVTVSGTSSAFVWFRTGYGGLYGEAYDANDANPGSVRFDDSSYLITVSGNVYADAGVTPLGAPTCNGVTQNVRLVVDGGSYASSTSCNASTGAYTFTNVAYVGDPKLIVYLNTNGGVRGTTITKTPTTNITNFHVYANRVITRHEDTAPLTIADMTLYNGASDTDIAFTVTGSSTGLLLQPNTELYVFGSTTFAPGGNVTLLGNANATSYEGTLALGTNAVFSATGTQTHTLAGRLVAGTGASIVAASSTFVFNATTTGKSITASSTLNLHNVSFTGNGGAWHITAPLSLTGDMTISTGTVTGTSDIRMLYGQLSGNGTLSLGGGTTTIDRSNTLGGTTPWTFYNVTLGSGSIVGTTTRAATATTTVAGRLTISNAHTLEAGSSLWDLTGSGTVFVETGVFKEDTSLVTYSGTAANVLGTTYHRLTLAAPIGSATYTLTGSGLSTADTFTVGNGVSTSVVDGNTNDPVVIVGGNFELMSAATYSASNLATTTFAGSYNNDGTFTNNAGISNFTGTGTHTIDAGSSSFGALTISGTGAFTVSSAATSTGNTTLRLGVGSFTVASGQTLAVGGAFLNALGGSATTWTGSTLSLYGTTPQTINASTTSDTYETLRLGSGTHVRMWNSSATSVTGTGGLYSQDHAGVNGSLYIYGTLVSSVFNDYWSYATDFDGTSLAGGQERAVTVSFASGAVANWNGGSLSVLGSTTASTTLQNQGSGTYLLHLSGSMTTNWHYVTVRNAAASGIMLSGTPTVTDFSATNHEVAVNSGTAITVGGTVINANEAKNFTANTFTAAGGVTGATNVTATGTAVSSWRFTNHSGAVSGEANDVDPAGDPGYVVWDDSAALITVSGNVYSDEGVTVSSVCDNLTNNIVLRVAGLTTYSTSCNSVTGAFTITNVAFNALDTLTLYIDGEFEKAANVTVSPISSISNMHLYENRVILRHENTNPISIANMSVWDSSDDADIPFTAVDAGTDTLTLPSNRKLLIWTGKTFEPGGNVTLSGGGGGAAYDGTLEAQANARLLSTATEQYSIGGSFVFGSGAVFTAGLSTTTFTTTGSGRSITTNGSPFYNAAFTGSGSWTITDAATTFGRSYAQSNGIVTFGSATTTVGASFAVTGGSFAMTAPLYFISTSTGNVVRANGVTLPLVYLRGTGGAWTFTDTNATTTGGVIVDAGTVTLPSGIFTTLRSFENRGGTIIHNTSELLFTATSSVNLRANGSDLAGLRLMGTGTVTMQDTSLTLRESLTVATGTLIAATNTLSVGGSFDVSGGTFVAASGTVLFNSSSAGNLVRFGSNNLYNVQFGNATGGWTLYGNATTTNNFTLSAASSFTKETGTRLTVGGVFTNLVGGAATTWTGTTLALTGISGYTINSKSAGGDAYDTLTISSSTDIRMWNSAATTTTVTGGGSLYSQDHAAVDGRLYVYGDFAISSSTEYWSYATDFDGTTLSGGSRRAVTVRLANTASTTQYSGGLQIVGASGATTTIESQSGNYGIAINGGTFTAQYFSFSGMNVHGLVLAGAPTVSDISNGYFAVSTNTASLITVASTTLDANASKIFTMVGFGTTSNYTGYNVQLLGSTINAWRFDGSYGVIGGEAYDIDGIDACGSIRFDDSGCLLTEQTHVRWRNDNGGEGAPDSQWYSSSWDYRQSVRVVNDDLSSYASTAVKVAVPYDSAMQADFDDLRFTAADGVSIVPHWIEKYTASTDAVVWVLVPVLSADTVTTMYMYYGNGAASSSSSGATTFTVFDDFEDNSISEYSGDTGLFTTDTSPVYGGSYALEALNKSGRTTDGIYRNNVTVAQGQTLRYMQYVTTAGSGDEACTLFGVQNPGSNNQNYAVCLEQYGVDRVSLSRDVEDNDVSGTILASSTITFTTGWYEVEVDWRTTNRINVHVYNTAGTEVASTSAIDSNYTSGGIGYTFWFQNGSWDSYTARPIGPRRPTIYLGAKQTDGGATWAASEDAAGNAIPGDTKRLRVAIENSGLDITNQAFTLEYAPKGVAPSCEAVSGASYITVPPQASCGSSPICMQTSSYVTDNQSTTDLLSGTLGAFTSGKVVTSPSSASTLLDVNQSNFTELEYAVTPTLNASDSYCFRVTNGGVDLDYYAVVAELGLQFDPTLGTVLLNGGDDISLVGGTTTRVYATTTVTDFNGTGDLAHATATIYRSSAGASCAADANNCYISTTTPKCSFTDCSGNTCTLSCYADIYFHADPTDIGTYSGEEWLAYLEVSDQNGGYDFASAIGVELTTLRALSVDSAINYGSLAVSDNTGSYNPTTTVSNLGNTMFDIEIDATNLTDGHSSQIPAEQQKFATSSFTYTACVSCSLASSTAAVPLPLDLPKPTSSTVPTTAPIYWGIAVPLGTNSAPHQGVNVFTPVEL